MTEVLMENFVLDIYVSQLHGSPLKFLVRLNNKTEWITWEKWLTTCYEGIFIILHFPFKHKRIQKGQKRKIQTRMSVGCKREIFHIVKKMFIVYYHQNQCWMHFLFTIFFQYHILLASEWPKFFSLIIKTLSFFTNVGIENKTRNFNLCYKIGTIFNQLF